MLRLIPFELRKIWPKPGFSLAVCALLLLHLFLLWYTSLPGEGEPALSSYRAAVRELSGMGEEKKGEYLERWKETVDGVSFVRNILSMQDFGNEMGDTLAEQELAENPGVFEKYYELYRSGRYLRFTDSLERESALAEELCGEQQRVAGYGEYLASVRESRDDLSGISIFGGGEKEGFSSRNLEKSAEDYGALAADNLSFFPSKSLVSAMEGWWTDLLLFLALLLFVGYLVTEEKEKGLYFITRSTKYGILPTVGAKLAALLVHCFVLTAVFYGVGLLFFILCAGGFDPMARLQSMAPYGESSLPVTILAFILLSLATKAAALFAVGALLTAVGIVSGITVMPVLAGCGAAGISALLYIFVPAGQAGSLFKYLNPVGLMKTENLYGKYLNFNVFGYPVSRLAVSLWLLFILAAVGVLASLRLYAHMQSFAARRLAPPFTLPFWPHVCVLRHEAYKILVMNRGLLLFIVFAGLLGFKCFDHAYVPSAGERYYRDLMSRLEGGLTPEKEAVFRDEQERYEAAFERLEQIGRMESEGRLSRIAADELKSREYMALSFYPAFQRVEAQYENCKERGGGFVYDTGYLYLFGAEGGDFAVDLLILVIGIILAAGGAIPMEYRTGSLYLLSATRTGRRRIFLRKTLLCVGLAAALALVPLVCRFVYISSVYPMGSPRAAARNLPCFSGTVLPLPVWAMVLVLVLSQTAAAALAALATLVLSLWRKNQVQTVFFALLLLAVPLVACLLGFDAAKWFSLYPLYGWTGML